MRISHFQAAFTGRITRALIFTQGSGSGSNTRNHQRASLKRNLLTVTVTDASDAVVPSANVTVVDNETYREFKGTTDAQGRSHLHQLEQQHL